MATIRPFMGIRPAPEYAKDVAALPYDVMNTAEAREMVKGNPYSFLHIDRAEIDLPVGTDPYSPAVYEKAKDTFYDMLDKGIFTQDLLPNFYIYRLTMDGRSQKARADPCRQRGRPYPSCGYPQCQHRSYFLSI